MSLMDSMQGMQGLSGNLRMMIGDTEQYQMLQIRGQAATLAVQKAQDALNKAMETARADDQNEATAKNNLLNAQTNYNEAVVKYGANSKQAQQAQAELTKATEEYNTSVQKAQQATQQITVDQQALQVAQERAQYYQERTNLDYLMMATQVPMFIGGISRSAEALGGLGDSLGGVGETLGGAGASIAEFAGGLTLTGVAAGAVVAGVVVAAGAIVATGISLYQAHQSGESYVQTYSRWAANIHQTMPGIAGDIVAAAGLVSAGWLQMGQDLQTKGIPAVENFAGSISKDLGGAVGWVQQGMGGIGGMISGAVSGAAGAVEGAGAWLGGTVGGAWKVVENFGSTLGRGFVSMFSQGGQVYSYLTQGVGYLQQLWQNVWSPAGTGLSGYANMGQMVTDAFLGPAGMAANFPTLFNQLSQKVSPVLSDFGKTISEGLSNAFGGVTGGLGGATSLLQPLLTSFQQFPSQAMASLAQISATITSAFTQITAPITSFGTSITSTLSNAFTAATNAVTTFGGSAVAIITGAFNTILSDAQTWGNQFVSDVANFVQTAAADLGKVSQTISVAVQTIPPDVSGVIAALASIPKTIVVTIEEVVAQVGAAVSGGGGGPLPSERGMQGGGYTGSEGGWWYLHPYEYVIPESKMGRTGPTALLPSNQPINLNTQTTLRLDGQALVRNSEKHQIFRRTSSSGYKWS